MTHFFYENAVKVMISALFMGLDSVEASESHKKW